jgi:hypothetical protein
VNIIFDIVEYYYCALPVLPAMVVTLRLVTESLLMLSMLRPLLSEVWSLTYRFPLASRVM